MRKQIMIWFAGLSVAAGVLFFIRSPLVAKRTTVTTLTTTGTWWRLQVIGANHTALTIATQEPIANLVGRFLGPSDPLQRSVKSVEQVVPRNSAVVPALDVIGALEHATGTLRYHLTQHHTLVFHPALVRTTIRPQLDWEIQKILPAHGSAIVVSPRGSVLALVGRNHQWQDSVPAGASLLLPLLAEINAAPSASGADWNRQKLAKAWERLGLNQSALALSPRPSGLSATLIGPVSSPVLAPVASIAHAYLPFIAGGKLPELGLTIRTSPVVSRVPERVIYKLTRLLPRTPVDGTSFSVWHPLGQGVVVAWTQKPPSLLVVATDMTSANIAPLLSILARSR